MTAEKYVNAIVKKIKCGKKRREESKQQLLSDIGAQMSQGRRLDNIMRQMGAASEIAEGFNENLSDDERKKYRRTRRTRIFVPIFAVIIILVAGIYAYLPKSFPIEDSAYFQKDIVEECIKNIAIQVGENDYAALRENATEQMKPIFAEDYLPNAKNQLSSDWGQLKSFGSIYLTEVSQLGKHFAVGEITVVYENITVTYRLSFDKDMRLAGMYMR